MEYGNVTPSGMLQGSYCPFYMFRFEFGSNQANLEVEYGFGLTYNCVYEECVFVPC